MPSITQQKSQLRQQIRKARKSLTHTERAKATQKVNIQLKRFLKRGKKLAVYWAVGSEISLTQFIRSAQQRKIAVYLPYIEPRHKRLWFTPAPHLSRQHTPTLKIAQHKIPQFQGKKIRVHRLNTLVLPLIGCDYLGNRLGQGGGFYDTTLQYRHHLLRPKLIGVGFACQYIPHIPTDTHDQPLDMFICESGYYPFSPSNHVFHHFR